MSKYERRVLEYLQKHYWIIFGIITTVAGCIIRIALRNNTSGDYIIYLEEWYKVIKEHGLSQQVGNYNILYQFLIYLLTLTKIHPLYAYKFLSVVFDFILALAIGYIVWACNGDDKKHLCILAYSAIWLSPIVFLNSAAWAQCDAIYTSIAIWAIVCLEKEKYLPAFILLGLSFSFKLQAVFFLPVFLFVYFIVKKFSIVYFTLVPVTMIVTALPVIVAGWASVLDVFNIYAQQTDEYPRMFSNYPSVWGFLCPSEEGYWYYLLKYAAIAITICILALIMFIWIQNNFQVKGKNIYYLTFLMTYTCVLFLPAMHERYSYPVEALAVVLAVILPQTIPLCIGLVTNSMITYGSYLFGIEENWRMLTYVNLIVYVAYFILIYSNLKKAKADESTELKGGRI